MVAGVLCLYLLVGLFFAFTYTAVQNLGGAPFFANGAAAASSRSLYFSFVTMTTVGYGDYTARTNLGHTMSVTEALLGQICMVTVVAAMVSRMVPRRRANPMIAALHAFPNGPSRRLVAVSPGIRPCARREARGLRPSAFG